MNNICQCCHSGLKTKEEIEGKCFLCGATQEACALLKKNSLDPWEEHQKLSGRPGYNSLTLNIAKLIVQVYETDKSKAH